MSAVVICRSPSRTADCLRKVAPSQWKSSRAIQAIPRPSPRKSTNCGSVFSLKKVILVGDRGMLTSARIREDLNPHAGLQWISALKSVQIQKLITGGALQLSFFDQQDMAEIQHPSFPGERLIACLNPLLFAEESELVSVMNYWRPLKSSSTKL